MKVFEVHKQLFDTHQQALGQHPYSFRVEPSRLHSPVLTLLRSTGFNSVVKEFEQEMSRLEKPNTHVMNLSQELGLDVISRAYKDHLYGRLLGEERSMLLAVMRFSQVLGSPAKHADHVKELFLEKFAKALKGLGQTYAMRTVGRTADSIE